MILCLEFFFNDIQCTNITCTHTHTVAIGFPIIKINQNILFSVSLGLLWAPFVFLSRPERLFTNSNDKIQQNDGQWMS